MPPSCGFLPVTHPSLVSPPTRGPTCGPWAPRSTQREPRPSHPPWHRPLLGAQAAGGWVPMVGPGPSSPGAGPGPRKPLLSGRGCEQGLGTGSEGAAGRERGWQGGGAGAQGSISHQGQMQGAGRGVQGSRASGTLCLPPQRTPGFGQGRCHLCAAAPCGRRWWDPALSLPHLPPGLRGPHTQRLAWRLPGSTPLAPAPQPPGWACPAGTPSREVSSGLEGSVRKKSFI